MGFDPQAYGVEVAKILALSGDGHRLIPLVCDAQAQVAAPRIERALFADSAHPVGALAGIWVYLSHFDKAHEIAQDDHSPEGSYWHAILHRQEPDDFNSGYWFRRVGKHHPVYAQLAEAAAEIAGRNPGCGFPTATVWDPHAFLEYCSGARSKPGSLQERVAVEVQRAEWQLLFDHCAHRIKA